MKHQSFRHWTAGLTVWAALLPGALAFAQSAPDTIPAGANRPVSLADLPPAPPETPAPAAAPSIVKPAAAAATPAALPNIDSARPAAPKAAPVAVPTPVAAELDPVTSPAPTGMTPERLRELVLANQRERAAATAPDSRTAPLGPATIKTNSASTESSATKAIPLGKPVARTWLFDTFMALGGVLILIFVVRGWLLRSKGPANALSRRAIVEVLSRTNVTPKNRVLLLRLGHRLLLVSESPTGMQTLADINDPDEVALLLQAVSASKPQSITASFAKVMDRCETEHTAAAPTTRTAGRAMEGSDNLEVRFDQTRDQVGHLLSSLRRRAQKGAVR